MIQKLLLLLLFILVVAAAYSGQKLVKRFIDPRRSFGHFLLFILLNLLLVFILSMGAGILIFQYKEFFFKG